MARHKSKPIEQEIETTGQENETPEMPVVAVLAMLKKRGAFKDLSKEDKPDAQGRKWKKLTRRES